MLSIQVFHAKENKHNHYSILYGPNKSGKTHLGLIWKEMNKAVFYSNDSYNNIIQCQKNIFVERKSKLDNDLSVFDSSKLLRLENGLEKSISNISDAVSKTSIIQEQIDSSKNSINDMISKLELNLKQASSVSYQISYGKNDL